MTDEISAAEKLKSVEREIKMRKRVYPRFVESGKMSLAQSDIEIRIMEAIADDYRQIVEAGRLL